MAMVTPSAMGTPPLEARFIRDLTRCQTRLYAYICTLVPDAQSADDILQNTNVVLWEKRAQHAADAGQEGFAAWALRVAHFEVRTHRKRQARDRLLFDDDLLELVARDAAAETECMDERTLALRGCVQSLTDADRGLLQLRYEAHEPVRETARRIRKSVAAVSQALYRIRNQLAKCVQRALSRGGAR